MQYSLLSAIVLIALGTSTANADGQKVPDSLAGSWRIVSAEPDSQATAKTPTSPDDPRYVGRVINFGATSAHVELMWDVNCQQPTYTPQSPMTLDDVILKTSGERYVAPKIPVAKDFGFKQPGNLKVTPILIQCKSGYLSMDGAAIKNWVALLSADSAVMNWFDNSYVVLQRVKPGEKTNPSFSCDGKVNAVEQTICSSDDLSSWDRSVANAYKTRLWQQQDTDAKDTAAIAQIKTEQRNWLNKRNQCKNDAECIKKSMKDRVEALIEQFQ